MRRRHAAHNPARLDREDVPKAVDQEITQRQTHGLALVRVDKPRHPTAIERVGDFGLAESQLAGKVELTPRTGPSAVALPSRRQPTNFSFQTTSLSKTRTSRGFIPAWFRMERI